MEFVPDWACRALVTYILPSTVTASTSSLTSYVSSVLSSFTSSTASNMNDYSATHNNIMNAINSISNNNNNNNYASSIPPSPLLGILFSFLPAPLPLILQTTYNLSSSVLMRLSAIFMSSTFPSSILSSDSATSSTATLIPIIAVMLLSVYVTLKIVALFRRLVSFAMYIAFRLGFLAVVGLLVALVVQRGPVKVMGDVVGWAVFWWEEWERLSQVEKARGMNGSVRSGGVRGGGYGGYGNGGYYGR